MIWDVPRAPLVPEFANAVDTIPGDWAVTYGFRTKDEQNALYAKGRDSTGKIIDQSKVVTYAPYPRSAHCWGMAVDLARVDAEGTRRWDYGHPAWKDLQAFVDASPSMHGGWQFPDPDNDHVQSVQWYKWRSNLITEGRW